MCAVALDLNEVLCVMARRNRVGGSPPHRVHEGNDAGERTNVDGGGGVPIGYVCIYIYIYIYIKKGRERAV